MAKKVGTVKIKKRKKKHIFLKLFGVLMGVGASIVGASALLYRKNMKKMEACEGEYNMMYSIVLGKQDVEVGEKIQNVFLSSTLGTMNLDMTKHPIVNDIKVEVFCLAGNVDIKLPQGVKVVYDGKDLLGDIECKMPECSSEEAFTVHISRNTLMSKMKISI